MHDLCVIGAGIVGLCASYSAGRNGQHVVVLDAGNSADSPRATTAAAGMLFPDIESMPGDLATWARQAFDAHFTLADTLGGADKIELRRVRVASDWRKRHAAQPQPYAAVVDPQRLSLALIAQLEAAGCRFEWQTNVATVRAGRDSVEVTTNRGIWIARTVVVATGFDLNFLAPTPLPPVTPDRGMLLEFRGKNISKFPSDLVMYDGEKKPATYALRRGDRLIVGATSEPERTDFRVFEKDLRRLLSRARKLLPGFALPPPLMIHVGHRPKGPDAWPILAKGNTPIVYVGATWRNGILFGPLLGTAAAMMAAGQLDDTTVPQPILHKL